MQSLEELVAAAQNGDQEAFGAVVEASWLPLIKLARTVLAGAGDAEDVVQDALLTGWTRLPTLRQPAAFAGWIRKIVYRACLARLRADRRAGVGLLPASASGSTPSTAPNQVTGDIGRALAALPPRQRAVIFLGDIEGYTDAEIAATLGLRRPTVRIHRMRARSRLRRRFEEVSR